MAKRYNSDDGENLENVCCGDCDVCPNKTFDSIEAYEFICDLDGHVVHCV